MNYVCFHLQPEASLEEIWQELEASGCQLLYSSEDADGHAEIYGYHPSTYDPLLLKTIRQVTPASLEIDWEAQWAEHGLDYHDGYVHVDLSQFGCPEMISILKLKPGPGFGDLSHPTTRIMLRLMAGQVNGKAVIDIGSGSGVLSIAALLMGARNAYGIDIDEPANQHAESNAELNGLQNQVSFVLPSCFQYKTEETPLCMLMNMIWSEQKVAWQSLQQLHSYPSQMLVSGILVEEREGYLVYAEHLGWGFVAEIEEEGWLAFQFNI